MESRTPVILSAVALAAMLAAACWTPASAHAAILPEATLHASVLQVAGADRYATSVKTSQQVFKPGASDTVVIASGEDWPDAVCGSALAGVHHAPLLLTRPNELPSVVAAEIGRLRPARAIVLGRGSAVSDGVLARLASLVASGAAGVSRIGGTDRYQTSALIALEVCRAPGGRGGGGEFFLATGRDFPDALAVTPIAWWQGEPILLTRADALPPSVAAAIPSVGLMAHIIGDERSVSRAVVSEVERIPTGLPPTAEYPTVRVVERMAGPNRYATSAAVASNTMYYMWDDVALATGERFPDALTAGVMQGRLNSPLLLTRRSTLPPETAAALARHARSVSRLRIMGDERAISANVRSDAIRALSY